MKRVTEFGIDGDVLDVACVDREGTQHADRFEGVVLAMRITSPMPDVVRVQVCHHRPRETGASRFDLDYSLSSSSVRIEQKPEHLVYTSGKLSVRIRKSAPWDMQFLSDGKPVTSGGTESLAYINTKSDGAHVMTRFSLGVGECVYGLGERFTPLVKNGQKIISWNEDGGTTSDQAYKAIPFYLTNRGYGVLVNSPGKVEFEICTERVNSVQLSVPGESLDYYIFFGPDPKDVLEKFTRLAGRPAVPPDWSFGLWLSTSFTTKYDEKTVTEFVDGMLSRGIPLKVFHFDCFWMKERHWCDFEWDRDAFPDPAGMIQRLIAKGLKISLWINPYISQLSRLFSEGAANGYFLKRADGSVYQTDQWQPGMAFVDFTSPAAVKWYQSKLQKLLDMGVDCFKTDFGERIPADAVYHDGSDPKLMHNYYTYLYNKSVFELLERHHGRGNALVFARSATVGSQKFPVHWGGDCDATFESMAEDLRGGLSFCMSGAAFWSHDIGGFNGTSNADVYKRWVAFGLLSTHSRLHGSGSYRVPWLFDEEAVSVMKQFARLKNRLFPYLFAAAHDANEFGWPVMRSMMLEYPHDPACLYLDRQYMLGRALLVAPIFAQDGATEFYLPSGNWTDLLTNKVVAGGSWRRETFDFHRLPLLVRENSIVPMSDDEEQPQWRAEDPLTLNLFQIEDGAELIARLVSSDRQRTVVHCRRAGEKISLESDGVAKKLRVLLRSTRSASASSNGKVREVREGLSFDWIDSAKPLNIALA
jgi:alpha-D-xyloside xylohydrolase